MNSVSIDLEALQATLGSKELQILVLSSQVKALQAQAEKAAAAPVPAPAPMDAPVDHPL